LATLDNHIAGPGRANSSRIGDILPARHSAVVSETVLYKLLLPTSGHCDDIAGMSLEFDDVLNESSDELNEREWLDSTDSDEFELVA